VRANIIKFLHAYFGRYEKHVCSRGKPYGILRHKRFDSVDWQAQEQNYYNFQREGNFEFLSSVEQAHF